MENYKNKYRKLYKKLIKRTIDEINKLSEEIKNIYDIIDDTTLQLTYSSCPYEEHLYIEDLELSADNIKHTCSTLIKNIESIISKKLNLKSDLPYILTEDNNYVLLFGSIDGQKDKHFYLFMHCNCIRFVNQDTSSFIKFLPYIIKWVTNLIQN